jgi:hypothetical protein
MNEFPEKDAKHDDHQEQDQDFHEFELHRVNQFGFRMVNAA